MDIQAAKELRAEAEIAVAKVLEKLTQDTDLVITNLVVKAEPYQELDAQTNWKPLAFRYWVRINAALWPCEL